MSTLTIERPIETALCVGAAVEVQNRFDGRWSTGFRVEAIMPDRRYRVRPLSDGYVLPVPFDPEALCEAR